MLNGNAAGIRDEPNPGNLSDPPLNSNVFANGAGFPGGAPGSGTTLTQAALNGTPAIPINGNYPPIPATSAAQWDTAIDNAVFHILTSMNRARLLEGRPLFPFGDGLSYTRFSYSHLTITPHRGTMTVRFDVTNTGSMAGDEVPQVYVGAPAPPPVPMSVKALAGFRRIHLAPRQTREVRIRLTPRAFQYWSVVTHDWATAQGRREIYVGSSSRDMRLSRVAAIF